MFTGLRVLELASVLAGPSVGQFFAELGAEVIKIENPKTGGDVTRSWKTVGEQTDDCSAYFCCCNWGKKSVALDLSKKNELDIVKKLCAKSDVVIASYKPGDAEKLGVDYSSLKKLNPKIIYGQITGYGSNDDRVGYDAVIQAESGFMELNGEADGDPLKMPVALIDVLAAHHLKEGLLIALLKCERTGEGSCVEVSLLQAAISSLANQATNWLIGKKLPTRQGSAHPNIAPYGDSFVTQDGKRILLAIGSDKQFEQLLKILSVDPTDLFSTNQKRVKNRTELNQFLALPIRKMVAAELIKKLHEQKIPAGFIQTLKDVFQLAQAKEILIEKNLTYGVQHFIAKELGQVQSVHLLPPPHLGEHTQEIINSL